VGVPKKPTGFFVYTGFFGYVPGCLNPADYVQSFSTCLLLPCLDHRTNNQFQIIRIAFFVMFLYNSGKLLTISIGHVQYISL